MCIGLFESYTQAIFFQLSRKSILISKMGMLCSPVTHLAERKFCQKYAFFVVWFITFLLILLKIFMILSKCFVKCGIKKWLISVF